MPDKLIKRHFTKKLVSEQGSVYDLFEWKKVDVVLTNYKTGSVITDMRDLEFPEFYSQSACDIIASKYFRKKGVPNDRGCEYSMKQLTHRMVNFWVNSLADEKLVTDEQRQIIYDELAYMLLSQMCAPNSPQWFNTGLADAYGVKGSAQGHYYFDEKKGRVVESEDSYTRTQGSACFILSIKDSLLGEKSLTDQLTKETLLFKYGSGVGTNWSPIRANGEYLSAGGKSSGLLSFLKVSDRNAGAIKSGGTTRRAAKMNILNIDHPEIFEYIKWKANEEDKAEALGKMGYSTSFEGEAYDTVSGQNSNNSVRIPDSFMQTLSIPGAKWKLKGRVDETLDREVSVSEMWDRISYSAWRCGDPGVQYDDVINAWHTCPYGEDGVYNAPYNRINASNPCSEYMFLDDTACNLASINVIKFYDCEKDEFDLESYLHCIMISQLMLEATIHHGQFPTTDIAYKSYKFRTTGLGLTNISSLLLMLGLPYDSDKARTLCAALTSIMTGYSYYTSALMAKNVGPFDCYDVNKEAMARVIKNHAVVAGVCSDEYDGLNYEPVKINHEILSELGLSNLSSGLKLAWDSAISEGCAHGYRNAQVSVLAPTGTISFAMDCAATSSEPFFSHVAYKKLVGGGFMEIVNPYLTMGLKKLGYSTEQIADILDYILRKENKDGFEMLADGKIEGSPHLKEEDYDVFDTASKCGSGSRFISPEGHVKMMGALAAHVTGAISKTVNMPNDSTVEDVKNIYLLSWQLGVKAIALYRDGCKVSQPLSATNKSSKDKPLSDYTYNELLEYIAHNKESHKPLRVKPSGIRMARVHEAAIDGLKLYITTSFYDDGRLGEIYVSSGRQGSLVKGLLDSISTTVSEMLQYGISPTEIARMYRGQKFEPSGFVSGHPYIKSVDSISDLISKIIDIELGDYSNCQVRPSSNDLRGSAVSHEPIKTDLSKKTAKDYIYGSVCPNCQSSKMVKNGTCKVCTECGTTTGCS